MTAPEQGLDAETRSQLMTVVFMDAQRQDPGTGFCFHGSDEELIAAVRAIQERDEGERE